MPFNHLRIAIRARPVQHRLQRRQHAVTREALRGPPGHVRSRLPTKPVPAPRASVRAARVGGTPRWGHLLNAVGHREQFLLKAVVLRPQEAKLFVPS